MDTHLNNVRTSQNICEDMVELSDFKAGMLLFMLYIPLRKLPIQLVIYNETKIQFLPLNFFWPPAPKLEKQGPASLFAREEEHTIIL